MRKELLLFTLALVLFSCKNNFKQLPNGLKYLFVEENKNSPKPQPGNIVECNLLIYTKDSLIFNSQNYTDNFRLIIKDSSKGLFYHALQMMHVGDTAIFAIDAKKLFEKNNDFVLLQNIEKNQQIYFSIRLLKILSDEEIKKEQERLSNIKLRKEKQILEYYLKENNIQTTPDSNGIYILTQQNNKPKPKVGDSVVISYNLKIINATNFGMPLVKNKTFSFVVGDTAIIEGLNIAIQTIPLKTPSTIIIPSPLAYGSKGLENIIDPYSSLHFDVVIQKIITKTNK